MKPEVAKWLGRWSRLLRLITFDKHVPTDRHQREKYGTWAWLAGTREKEIDDDPHEYDADDPAQVIQYVLDMHSNAPALRVGFGEYHGERAVAELTKQGFVIFRPSDPGV